MLKENINDLLNSQINKELYSAYLYVDFVRFFKERNLNGFARWYELQAEEEVEHAKRIFSYIIDNGGRVELSAISGVTNNYLDIMQVLKAALTHEQYITNSIEDIYRVAANEGDLRTLRMLDWFITEQAEEERNAVDNISNYSMCSDGCNCTLYMLDKDMGNREE